MTDSVALTLHDPYGVRVCELYSSECQASGQAEEITVKYAMGELTTLTFKLPTTIEDAYGELVPNFRWEHIRNEYLVFYEKNGERDVFRIKSPDDTVTGIQHTSLVTCLHRSESLKRRNLAQSFELNTDTARAHLERVVAGTGWTVGTVDFFQEPNVFEKQFALHQGVMDSPTDMAFGAYAEIKHVSGHSEWSGAEGWLNADLRIVSIGKNLCDGMIELGTLDAVTGAPLYENAAYRYRTMNYVYVAPFRKQLMTLSGSGFASANWHWYDSDKQQLTNTESRMSVTVPQSAVWLKVELLYAPGGLQEFPAPPTFVQLELGAATPYERYCVPYEINIGALGQYDSVSGSKLTRATQYDDATNTVSRLAEPTTTPIYPYAVKLYAGGKVYLENRGAGQITCALAYAVEEGQGGAPREKLRAFGKEAGPSAYDTIKALADVFGGPGGSICHPVFHGDAKTVDLVTMIGRDSGVCFRTAKNMRSIKQVRSSHEFITRLSVINQTSDEGYIGIENVNPLGTNFIMNFDYFEMAGVLTPVQRDAIETYQAIVSQSSVGYRMLVDEKFTRENAINGLVGQTQLAIAKCHSVSGGKLSLDPPSRLFDCPDPVTGDTVYHSNAYGVWVEDVVTTFDGALRTISVESMPDACASLIWVKSPPAGMIGSRLIELKTKNGVLTTLQKKLDATYDEAAKNTLRASIDAVRSEISHLSNGTADRQGINSLITSLVLELRALDDCGADLRRQDELLSKAYSDFEQAMGDLISDGVLPQKDYAAGQELALYNDAVEYLKSAAMPKFEYSVDAQELSKVDGYRIERVGFGDKVYLTSEQLRIENMEAFVTGYTDTPQSPKLNALVIGNFGADATQWMEDVFAAATTLKLKSKVYERAKGFDANGQINAELLAQALQASNVGATLNISSNQALADVSQSVDGRVNDVWDELSNVSSSIGYRVEITTSRGDVLNEYIGATTLTAHVWRGNQEVTGEFSESRFVWLRTSTDEAADRQWNAEHMGMRSVSIARTDVSSSAMYECQVMEEV